MPDAPVQDSGEAGPATASVVRRILSLAYEALLLLAVLWCAALPLGLVENALNLPHRRLLFQLYLVLVAGVYFVWQWTRGGQTLAMKTWRLRLVDRRGGAVGLLQAAVRYVAALAGTACFGLGYVWALFDRKGDFLHDRLAGTRIIQVT